MTFGFGMVAGLKALTAARLGIQTAGNNVANINTPGYSRQRVDLASALPYSVGRGMQIGTGVDVVNISRLIDEGLERRLRMQFGMVGSAEVEHSRWQEIEGIFNEPSGGLSATLAGFFDSIGRLQTDPGDRALRGGVVQAGGSLADGFRLMSRRFTNLEQSTFAEVRGMVMEVNQRASAVAGLNAQIIAIEAHGSTANDLRDTREQHIKEIAKYVDTQALHRSTGSVDLLVGGHLLVSGDRTSQLSVARKADGKTKVVSGTNSGTVNVNDGRVAALLRQEAIGVPGLRGSMDDLARNLILEVNRLQTTGMPRTGPFASLTSFYGAADGDGDGTRGDELLSQSGFAFGVQRGELFVNVSNLATGAMERHRIAIDPNAMTLQDLASTINGLNNLSASVDPTGRLRVNAATGHGFDFSTRLDPTPNTRDTLGGARPSLGSAAAGPFDLSAQTFPVSFAVTTGTAASPVTTTVTLDNTDFANLGAATTDEVVAAINTDLGTAGQAFNIGGRLVIRSNDAGGQAQMSMANVGAGTALQDLGLPTAVTARGLDSGLEVRVEGTWSGSANDQLVFVPTVDGDIGVTNNLEMRILDQSGNPVATVNVGAGYTPGEPIDIGNGVKVSFGPGTVSASANQAMAFDVLSDSDTTDVLVALGMNSMFHGSNASDITINADLSNNPDLLAAGLSNASGDAGNLLRLMGLENSRLAALSNNSMEDFYTDIVGDLGFSAAAAEQVLVGQTELLQQLNNQREAISGVNLDEEMVNIMQFQAAFDAAARFLSTVQELTNTLIQLGR